MNEAPLSDLPRVLSRPPWVAGRPSRELVVARITAKHSADTADALALFDSTAVFGGWRSDRDGAAWQHFETHLEPALAAILPIAVGEGGPRRKIAERVVRDLAVRHSDVVRAIAKRYGKKAVASVEEILSVDRRFDCPTAPPELPASFRPETFTRPHLADGRALPVPAVRRIGEMLAFSSLDRPYAGLTDVKQACEPRSLAELAWDMGRAWEAAGGPPQDAWMLESLASLADDLVIRRTTPAIAHPYIVRVLGYVGTNAAATELCTIAWRAAHAEPAKPQTAQTFAVSRAAARAKSEIDAAFAMIARRRGVTVEELEDSLMPAVTAASPDDTDAPVSSRLAGLRAKNRDARVTVEYGTRPLRIGIDERLEAFVQTAGGTRMRELPKPLDGDDRSKIAGVEEVWRELQEDIAAIADLRIRSLERALKSGRTWTLPAFRRAWLEHPLMRHVALGVVWRSGGRTFRIAEDGSFADIDDVTLAPGSVAEVSVANPGEMSDAEIARWAEVLEDYRIVQPIEQISRRRP